MFGAEAGWTTDTHLLATAVDALLGANWQRGGGKGKKPKPISRPTGKTAVVKPAISHEDAQAILDQLKPRG